MGYEVQDPVWAFDKEYADANISWSYIVITRIYLTLFQIAFQETNDFERCPIFLPSNQLSRVLCNNYESRLSTGFCYPTTPPWWGISDGFGD
jgi:hypothetical protein